MKDLKKDLRIEFTTMSACETQEVIDEVKDLIIAWNIYDDDYDNIIEKKWIENKFMIEHKFKWEDGKTEMRDIDIIIDKDWDFEIDDDLEFCFDYDWKEDQHRKEIVEQLKREYHVETIESKWYSQSDFQDFHFCPECLFFSLK